MRLIDADALACWINEQEKIVTEKRIAGTGDSILTRDVLTAMQSSLRAFENQIEEQPTAYDVDKVVEKLKSEKKVISCVDNEFQRGAKNGNNYVLNMAIEIVKRGGTDESK